MCFDENMADDWTDVQLYCTEIEDAITIGYTNEGINRRALHD